MASNGTALNNPRDPLGNAENSTRELFKHLGAVCNGFSNDAVLGAAVNLLANAVRQSCKSRQQAEASWDEIAARMKGVVLSHYDPVTGKRRNIFPFHQTIDVPYYDARKR